MPFATAIVLIAIGLVSILGQIVLLRELNAAFYGNDLIYILSFGLWIFWTAAGALSSRRNAATWVGKISLALFSLGPLLILDIIFIRGSRSLWGGIPGAELPFPQQILITALALFPVSFLTGLLFSWTANRYLAENGEGKNLGVAYALESAGGLAGGLLATLALSWGMQNLQLALICNFFALLVPLISGVLVASPSIKRGYFISVAAVCLLSIWLWPYKALDMRMAQWNHPHVSAMQDTPYGRIILTGSSGQISLFENDVLTYETEGTEAEAFVHPAALQHPSPRHILLLGGGVEGLLRELLRHQPERIDYVELNPVMLKIAVRSLPASIQESIKDPRVRIIHDDPRQYLTKGPLYDLILVGMPEPASGQANRFYSLEFFRECSLRLKPRGILGFRLKGAENFWTPPMMLRMGSIHRALRAVFPQSVFLPGPTHVITASFSDLPLTPALPNARWVERKINGSLVNPHYITYLYENDRFPDIRQRLEKATALVNTDNRPVCYRYSAVIWLAKFFPRLNAYEFRGPFLENRLPYGTLIITAILFFAVRQLFPASRRFLLMALVGFVGMVSETVLILHYQIKCGVLYQDIGVLLMSFMGGLALGALFFLRIKPNLAWGHGLAGVFCVTLVLIFFHLNPHPLSGLTSTMTLLCLTGSFVSAFFAFISRYGIRNQTALVAPLYGADLIGGCLGSLASGLFFIPFLGLDITMTLMVIISATFLILVG